MRLADLFPVRLESKMSGIEQMRFEILQIAADVLNLHDGQGRRITR